ncbi:MAG: PAS domain S-box protein [Candidatus Eisenbacteria bacterium]|nr:PAS domain S-box protein [Candidatus Eisenbacteria bacterium]
MTQPRPQRASGAPPTDALVQALMDDAEAGALLLDPQGAIAMVNPAAERLFGSSAARLRGVAASEVVRTVVAGDDVVREAFRTAHAEREAVLQTARGGEVPVQVRSYRLGKPPWVLITLHDLTQMRRMQQELRRHERLATLGQLAAGVAHEIRNPLAGIGTSAQVLLKRFEPRDERARFAQVILEEVARLDRIVTSLLQYARPRTPELRSFMLSECVDKVIALAADKIQNAQLRLETHVAPRLAALYIDPDLVTQVMLNVTINAIQAMPEGGTLRFEVAKVRRKAPPRGPGRRAEDRGGNRPPGQGWIEYQQVRVIDTGVGIPRGVLAKMFDPFFTTKSTGTGLGLSISQTIMQEHGGSITVDSREGRGTTVLLNFPLEKRNGERRQHDARSERPDSAHRR